MPPANQSPDFDAWNETYSVGHEELDRHHQGFLDLITELHCGLQADKIDLSVARAAGKLYNYAREHFIAEEALMAEGHCPGLEEHKKTHAGMVSKIEKITEEFHTYGETEAVEMLEFLNTWWLKHIRQMDKKYVSWLPGTNKK